MLNCREITEMASDYLDNNLDWRKRFSVRIHLFMCVHCNRFVEHLGLTIDTLRRKTWFPGSEEDVRKVISQIPGRDKS